ncbi:winged helix-turn-helix transcriptional regulator [Paenibacillus solisilvae]|uniref:Winged helix-turn-helix transcriptional regulator n=1 Tax=Paenibacillus solisilvae TaxID=2486751 RepID=A0ABW0VWH3_9BACL
MTRLLTEQLRKLEEAKLIVRHVYPSVPPNRQ